MGLTALSLVMGAILIDSYSLNGFSIAAMAGMKFFLLWDLEYNQMLTDGP